VDNTPPVSSVDPIEPYWQLGELRDPPSDMRLRTPIKITATASDDLSGVAKVELWYRYSLDNWTDTVAWKKRPWRLYGVDDNGADGWSWEFDAPEGYGYYEFYSIATDRAGNRGDPPLTEFLDKAVPTREVLVSRVFDSGKYGTEWLMISWVENCPEGTDILIQTRTGNTRIPSETWSDWSAPYENSEGEKIASPPARYIQYRAILTKMEPNITPVLHEVKITYLVADARCRIAKDLVKIAIVCAEPSDIEHSTPFETLEQRCKNTTLYFDEASYGALALYFEIYDNHGNWFKLPYPESEYLKDDTFSDEFLTHAIQKADAQIDYSRFINEKYIILVVGAGKQYIRAHAAMREYAIPRYRESWHEVETAEGKVNRIVLLWEMNPEIIWAHEIAHVLGKIFTDKVLPDLYKHSFLHESGDIGNFGLMGRPSPPVHPCSWSKERLGWLRYQDFSSYLGYVKSLPNLRYRDTVPRRWTDGWRDEEYFVFEARSRNNRYSRWDIGVPIRENGGLVLYKWYDPLLISWDPWRAAPTLDIVSNPKTGKNYFLPGDEYWLKPPFTAWYWFDEPGVLLSVLEENVTENAYEVRIHVREKWCWENRITARIAPAPHWWYGPLPMDLLPPENRPWPDLDLHAYTLDGRHVGVNYETGEYEMQIPGAIASGEFYNSSEWISVPDNIEVYFFVSSHDVRAFIENQGIALDNENGFYYLTVWYFDGNMVGGGSDAENQIIRPGAEAFHSFKITRIENRYLVEVQSGMDLTNLEEWRSKIKDIPDDLFKNRPTNRREALVNKFEAIFKMLLENNYQGTIEKLQNDVLEKLDADGEADWVKQPVLVNEIKAFIGFLRYKEGLYGSDI
jgi:M6 family metalloprotease-like protein